MVFHPASPPARVQGAPESLLDRCSHVRVGTSVMPMNASIRQEILKNIKFYGTGIRQGAAGGVLTSSASLCLDNDSMCCTWIWLDMRVCLTVSLHKQDVYPSPWVQLKKQTTLTKPSSKCHLQTTSTVHNLSWVTASVATCTENSLVVSHSIRSNLHRELPWLCRLQLALKLQPLDKSHLL